MRRHRSDRIIGVLTVLLMGIGLIVIYAIGPMRVNILNAAGADYAEQYFFVHQLISVVLALVMFMVMFLVPYQIIRKISKWVLIAGFAACALLEICYLLGIPLAALDQAESLGACRWFNLGVVSFQPAELLKLGLVLYLPQMLVEYRSKDGEVGNSKEFWVRYAVICGLALVFVVLLQKDLGTGLTMLAIMLAVLFMSGVSLKKFGLVLVAVAVAGMLAVVSSPHRLERLMTYGGSGDSDSSYHIDNALIAIGSGGILGVGVGNSVQATGYLPESINDSVFAVMGETFGFVGLMFIVVCFTVLLMRLLKVAGHLPGEESLVVTGVFAWAASHVVVNIMAMTGLVPLTGITLPLLSYGGTSMIMIAMGLGLSLQLSCYTGREVKNESISSRRGVGGTRYASRRSRS